MLPTNLNKYFWNNTDGEIKRKNRNAAKREEDETKKNETRLDMQESVPR